MFDNELLSFDLDTAIRCFEHLGYKVDRERRVVYGTDDRQLGLECENDRLIICSQQLKRFLGKDWTSFRDRYFADIMERWTPELGNNSADGKPNDDNGAGGTHRKPPYAGGTHRKHHAGGTHRKPNDNDNPTGSGPVTADNNASRQTQQRVCIEYVIIVTISLN